MTHAGGNGEPSPGSPASVLFGAVSIESAASAIVRRLRAAIALGLLRDGDRLPPEADLARRLGVTTFAMREALGTLRHEGLITTRAGKNGGSFVMPGTDRGILTSGELRRMSATELRELGDWRQMLASVSAWLAAQRASPANVHRLRSYAEALADAETELEARRAHGRFHVELAAAAQSIRMTRAELAMYEEFDWLLGLALADDERRRESAAQLVEIADAVDKRLPGDARAAAERHSAATVDALVKLRLAALASEGGECADRDREGRTLAQEINRLVGAVGRSLEALATRVGAIVREHSEARELHELLARMAMSSLLDSELELHGLGFIAQPHFVPGHDYWIAWWQLTPDGVASDDRHVMDPSRDDFYDYVSQSFFTVPRRRGDLFAQGPYVDYGGTNEYIITFSVPVLCDRRFIGVTAADLPVAAIERKLAPWLARSSEPCVVINAERRVIVTNLIDHTVGDVLPLADGVTTEQVTEVGWSISGGSAN